MFRFFALLTLLFAFILLSVTDAFAYQKGNNKEKNAKANAKAKANDGVITNWNKPPEYGPGKVNAYWIWYDDGMWRFRTTGGGKGTPRFHGRIELVGGQFAAIKGLNGEVKGTTSDRYVFNSARNALAFDFKTNEGQDGLNFNVTPGTSAIRYTLAIDGEAHPKHIRVGKAGDHPKGAIFTTPGNPPDKN